MPENNGNHLDEFMNWLQEYMQGQQQQTGQGANGDSDAAYRRALQAIWENREDIRNLYWAEPRWGPDVNPIQAVEDWWSWTPENTGGTPYEFATQQGYMDPNEAVPMGGIEWARMALTAAIAAAEQAYNWAVLQGQNDRDAKSYAMQQAELALQQEIALGYVNDQPTLARQQAEWNRELQQQNLGMEYLALLSQQRGPADWVSYWNTVRAAQQTPVPAWAKALIQGQNLPAWQQPYYIPTWQQGAQPTTGQPAQQANAQGQPPWYAAAQGQAQGAPDLMATWQNAAQQMVPWHVSPEVWGSLSPTEQQGALGMIDSVGGSSQDWYQAMQNAWPTGGNLGNQAIWRW
jgi:hypothetical protein